MPIRELTSSFCQYEDSGMVQHYIEIMCIFEQFLNLHVDKRSWQFCKTSATCKAMFTSEKLRHHSLPVNKGSLFIIVPFQSAFVKAKEKLNYFVNRKLSIDLSR